jgi:hypothetical protein
MGGDASPNQEEETMNRVTTAVLFAALIAPPAFAVGKGKAKYLGGTIAMKEKKEAPFELGPDSFSLSPKPKDGEPLAIAWESITSIEYGQQAGRRIKTAIFISPLALFGKSRKHYVTLTWESDGESNAAVFEFDKNDIRSVLATLKAKTDQEIVYLDEEAQKQMGGERSR